MKDLFVKESNYKSGIDALQKIKVTPATFKLSHAMNKKESYVNDAIRQV